MKFGHDKAINFYKSRFGVVDNAKPQLCPVNRTHPMLSSLKYLPARSSKQRATGINIVIDTGLSINQAENLLSAAESYVDFIKFGFGTAFFTGGFEGKLALYRASAIPVFFGGTIFEAYAVRNQFDDYLRLLDMNQITYAEVSDGSLRMTSEKKCRYIERLSTHVQVFSEVGSKSDTSSLTVTEWVNAIKSELEAGASRVIAEARESGTAGVCKTNGDVRADLIFEILKHVSNDRLIWEAPTKKQQAWMVNTFGANVNLGNIQPDDVISLEALRRGLRGDTFLTFLPEATSDGYFSTEISGTSCYSFEI
jgi:phosphosulfolactate synthase